MATQELVKSLEAKKLNKRSKLPLPEPPVTLPFGALVQDLEQDGGMIRFTYLGELYHCEEDRMRSALGAGAAGKMPVETSESAAPAAAKAASNPAPAAAEEARFRWEEVPTNQQPMWRAKVPGGWLVATGTGGQKSLAFYPDATHTWDGSTINS